MVSLAVLLAVLAVAVPVHRTAWANEPVVTISVTDINYETATASFTVTGLPDSVTPTNWIASVNYKTPPDRYGHTLRAGPGKYSETQDDFTAVLSGNTLTADIVHLTRLIPDSEHTLTVTIMQRVGRQSPERAKDSTTFTAESGCSPSPEPNHKDPESISPTKASWFGIYEFRHVTETEFMLEVSLNPSFERKHAPVNSGACVYYKYDESFGTFQSGIITAYIHDNLSGGKRGAFIRHTGLTPATRYGFRLTMDKESDVGDITVYGTTLGPNTGIDEITFTDITQNRARATATIENASSDPKFGYWHYRKSPIDGEPEGWGSRSEKLTEGATFPIELDNLDAGTRYELEASVKDNFNPNMSMTKAFVTLPGKPGISPLEVGDGSLKVTWTAPTEGAATITGYRVQWQEDDEYFDYNTSPPPTSTLDYDDVAADITNHTIENLTNGIEYVVIVIAKNESFDDFGGTASDYESGTPMTLPNAPNNLQVAPGIEQLTLSWDEPAETGSADITGYVVEYKKQSEPTIWSSHPTVTAVAGTTAYETTISNLDFSTEYDVRVRADNDVALQDDDGYNWTEGSETTLPDKPTSLAVESGNRQLTLSWEEPSDLGSVNISDYVVQYRKTSETSWTTSSATNQANTDSQTNITTYSNTFTALDYSTDYDVRVRADNGVTLQDEDNYNWAEDDGQTIPNSPGNLEVTPGNEMLTLTWDAPADSGSISISSFIVQYKKTADSGWNSLTPLSASTLVATIGSLDNDDLYFVRVRAVNIAELDDEDDYNWARDEGTPVPSPSIETVTVDANSVTQTEATVTVTLDRTNDVTQKVYLQYRTVSDGQWITPSKPDEDTDAISVDIVLNTFEGNTEYEVQAWLETDVNTKVKSEPFTTKPVPPGAPTNTAVTPGDTIIELSWDPPLPADNGGSPVTHYVIEWVEYLGHNWETSTLQSGTPTDEEYEITGRTNGTRYAIRLRADNLEPLPAGKSYNWVFTGATPRTIPAAPTVEVTPDNARLHVSWNKPDNGGEEITGFVVQYKKNADSAWITHAANAGSNTLKTTIPDLDNGELYDVRVRAFNSATVPNEDDYNWGKDDGTPRTVPAEPALTVTAGNAVLEVSWDEPDDGGDTITGHIVQYKKNTDDSWDTSNATIDDSTDAQTEITSYKTIISNLDNGETYLVRVRAVNSVVLDDEEDYNWGEGSGKPITIPGLPTVSVTPGNAQLEVNWNKPDAGGDTITGFVVQYMKDTDTGWTDHSTPGKDETSTTISSLDNGDMYTVRVRAVNSVVLDDEENYNWGDDSNKPRTIPNASDSLTVTHGSQQLTATWEKPTGTGSDGGAAITGYEVQWKEKSSTGWSSRSFEYVTGIDTLTLTFSQHSGQALTNGVTYEVRVRAVNTVMLTDEEDYKWKKDEETPSTMPGAPQRVRISDQGDGELTVEWGAPTENGGDDIRGYVVQWRVKGISNWETTSTTEDDTISADKFSHTFDRHLSQLLANGVKYEARVIAKNRNGRGTPSAAVEGKPRTTPNAPTDLEVTEGNAQLELTWTAPTETGGTDIDYYIVEHMKAGGSSFTPVQTTDATAGWTLDNLENGKLYTIQVKSHTEGGTSEPSGQATGKPRTIPGKPTITAVTAGNRTLTVTWAPPTDTGGDNPSKYIIEWEEWIESTSTWQASGSAEDENGSPYEISGLTNGTLHRVVVKAHNAAGTGPASDAVEGTPKTIPDAPSVELTPGDEELKVEWNKPGDGGAEITGFIVQYKKDTDPDWTEHSTPGPDDTTATIVNLDNGDPYKVRVRAVNTAEPDAGQVYNWGQASGIPRTVPAAPTVSLTHGDRQLEVTWDKPDDGGNTITGFVVQYKKAADAAWIGHSTPGPDDTTTTIIRLDNGVPYDVRVRAVNTVTLDDEDDYIWGKKSETPRTIPEAPTNFEVVVGDEELTLSWVAPITENNGGAAIKRYVVQWKSGNEDYDPDPDSSRQTTTPLLTKVLADLSNGTLYSLRVRADNGETVDDDDDYKWASETGMPMTVPGAPTMLRVEQGDRQLVVSWVAPEETGGEDVEIENFLVQWQVDGGNWNSPGEHTTTDETVLTDTITTLLNGTDYDIRVAAANSLSESDNYIWAYTTGKPRTIPGPPRSLRVTAGDGQLTLSWAAPSDNGGLTINRYVVQWKKGNQQYDTSRQATPTTTSQVIGQLDNGTPYSIQVRADNSVVLPNEDSYKWATGNGTPAAAQNPPPPPPPPPPNNPPPQRSPVNPTPPVTESPEVASVSVTNETQTTADATVKIDNAGTAQNTVNLRYSVDGENSWTNHTKTETGSTVEFPLSSLMAGTTYEVEAWLGSDTGNKATATFTTTLPAAVLSPIINSVRVGNILETTATATVNIDNADGSTQTAKLQYRTTNPQGNWSSTYENTSTTGTTIINFGGMTAGTRYQVQAWLASDASDKVTASFQTQQAAPNNPPPQRSPVNPTPPVTKSPEVASVSVTNETQTTADATVKIDNAGTAQNTVNLRYSVDGEDSWTDHTKTETGSAVEFPLSGLTAGTTYEVEAWLGSDTDNKVTATFMTTQADAVTPPSISSVRVLNIAQTSARVVVGLANANAEQRVYMQYKLSSAQWPTTLPQPTTQMNGSATFILSSLTAGTGYHTRVSLNSDMSDATTRSFTTSSPPPPQNPPPPRSPVVPPPSVSLVTFNNETQTSADATVNIADAGTAKKTVRLHHRIEGTTGWSTPPKVMKTPGSSTTILLTGLTAGTTYEVQAWLNSNAPPTGTTVYTFNTLPNDPDISNLKMKNIRQTSATAMVEIADAGTGMKEVYLKHSIDGTDEWSQLPFPTITYADSTSIELTGLEEQTTYQVMVDLTDGFDKAKSSTFTTLAAPSLSGVSISSITRTGAVATATIADAGTAQKTMHLRYREFGETEWSTAQAKTTTGASAVFNLTGLDPRTTYEVQASLDIEFGTSKYAVFTTLSPDPSVSGVSVGSITQTSATTTVTIAYPGIARKTVRLRYRVSGETEWGAVQTKVTSGGSAAIDLTGLSPRTTYEVEASLSSDFAGSKTATFSTLSLDPSVSGVSIGSITQTSAAATVTIANPGTAQKTVYLQYRVDGASEWSDSALTATTDGPSATIYMTGLIADTEYEVRASLASDFALAQHATFTTLRYPSIY